MRLDSAAAAAAWCVHTLHESVFFILTVVGGKKTQEKAAEEDQRLSIA